MRQKQTKNILTIGDGIAAWCLHEELLKLDNVKIVNMSAEAQFPACSLRSTSINCLRGTRPGVSALGDLILKSYQKFEVYYKENSPAGIHPSIEYQTWNDVAKWKRRYSSWYDVEDKEFLSSKIQGQNFYQYNDAYFLEPREMKNWYRKRHGAIEFKEELVKEISDSKKVFTEAAEYKFDIIIMATGYASATLGKGYNEKFDYYLDHCKPVAGTYLEIDIKETDLNFDSSFNLAIGPNHFIYRKEQGVIQIGSTNDNRSDDHRPNINGVKQIYNYLSETLIFDLPDFQEFRKITGIRHKGFERMPYWGEIATNIYAISGLYKNAYTFAYQAASDIKKSIESK
ncbi:MAG: hypothetical protein ACJAS4_001939 [Bacteriovoracaceae bacterium]